MGVCFLGEHWGGLETSSPYFVGVLFKYEMQKSLTLPLKMYSSTSAIQIYFAHTWCDSCMHELCLCTLGLHEVPLFTMKSQN